MSNFPGVALVIGAGSGDGRAVARLLVRSGCTKVVLGDANEIKLAKVLEECRALVGPNLQISGKKCDTQVPTQVDDLIAFAVMTFGKIDYCANCERPNDLEGKTLDIALSDFSKAPQVWQRGVWLSMRAEVRQFLAQKEKGQNTSASIVNVSAAQGLASERGFPSYCAAAHGIVGMSRATALDHLRDGIRINCVCPAPSGQSALGIKQSTSSTDQQRGLPICPLERGISAEEVAQAVVFLLGESASAITGVELPADGGWSLKHL